MRRLNPPNNDAVEVYRRCAQAVRSAERRNRMLLIESDVKVAAENYINAATLAVLHELPQTEGVAKTVSTKEMVSLYQTHMVRKDAVCREVYDLLMAAPRHKKCPLCGQRVVSTIDHHLPESLYPTFALFPHNLIPACKDCNKEKGASMPTEAANQTIHPYFDDFESERWLYAFVLHRQPAAIKFLVSPPAHWDEIKKRRAEYHFKLLKLDELYAVHAAEELINIRYYLENLYSKAGSEGISNHLQDEAISRAAAYTNSWQTATYEVLANDNWFCEGGFMYI